VAGIGSNTFLLENTRLGFLKQGISHQLGRDAVVRFECENSAIDVIINFFLSLAVFKIHFE
jgi:hypothetical protein